LVFLLVLVRGLVPSELRLRSVFIDKTRVVPTSAGPVILGSSLVNPFKASRKTIVAIAATGIPTKNQTDDPCGPPVPQFTLAR
jgi:hypothetical protein